ncbi:hypothetical protein MLD38_022505 [Melastoma candidum]|uniref:Uncharacterized protein n=1 Tax=Melastoma candidum TaxID=119954 RepID=A0ACB9QLA5_9MYRT|nr:hypothetical protein MLD38_022505 [Melastoma candidum]
MHRPKIEEMQLLGLSAMTASEVSARESTTLSLSSAVAVPLSIRIPLPGLGESNGPDLCPGWHWTSSHILPDEPCLRNETEDLCNVVVIDLKKKCFAQCSPCRSAPFYPCFLWR